MSVIQKQQSFDKIPITRPFFNYAEEEAIQEVVRSGWLVQGPKVATFEGIFRDANNRWTPVSIIFLRILQEDLYGSG